MKTVEYVITDPNGIHARPAGLFVKEAGKYQSDIKLIKDGKEADAKRLFAVMGLGVKSGEQISLTISGVDEDAAQTGLAAFLKENL